jgi:hypothetical protein
MTDPSADGRNLDGLLSAAADAAPGDRIAFRDPIAAFGADAIRPIAAWLVDQRLGAFAVRVLVRIGQKPQHIQEVRRALQSVATTALSPAVARDVTDAVSLLAPSTGRAHGRQVPEQLPWPGDRDVTPLESRFHEAMLEIYKLAGEATRRRRPDGTIERGYWANYFLRAVRTHGGRDYARRLLRMQGTTEGFERLKKEQRLDLTMEALVLRPEYAPLFTDVELSIASRRVGGLLPPRERTATDAS